MVLTFRPIKVWPDGWRERHHRPRSPFGATYSQTLRDLDRELYQLNATGAVLPVDAAPHALVPAKTTWRLLDDLLANGWTRGRIARALGSKAVTPSLQLRRDRVTAENARKVKALHDSAMASVLLDRRLARDRRRAYRQQVAA